MDINEKDWKLFKSKLVDWQENYIARLNKEYIDILSQSKNASEIFWELEKRINNDKRNPGVALYCKRSNTVQNVAALINANVYVLCFVPCLTTEYMPIKEVSLRIYRSASYFVKLFDKLLKCVSAYDILIII